MRSRGNASRVIEIVFGRQDARDGIYYWKVFPKTRPFGPMFIGI